MLRISLIPDVADSRISQKAAAAAASSPVPLSIGALPLKAGCGTLIRSSGILLDQDESDVNLGERSIPSAHLLTTGTGPAAPKQFWRLHSMLVNYEVRTRQRGCGPATSPWISAQMYPLAEIHCRPVQRHGATFDERHRAEIEPEPGQKRITTPIGPDLGAGRRAGTEAARMETDCIGNHERILGHREHLGLTEAEPTHSLGRDPQRAPRCLKILALCRAHRRLALPCEASRGRPVRSRHVNERTVLLGHISQKEPGLDGRMKRIGVQPRLRIRRRLAHL